MPLNKSKITNLQLQELKKSSYNNSKWQKKYSLTPKRFVEKFRYLENRQYQWSFQFQYCLCVLIKTFWFKKSFYKMWFECPHSFTNNVSWFWKYFMECFWIFASLTLVMLGFSKIFFSGGGSIFPPPYLKKNRFNISITLYKFWTIYLK